MRSTTLVLLAGLYCLGVAPIAGCDDDDTGGTGGSGGAGGRGGAAGRASSGGTTGTGGRGGPGGGTGGMFTPDGGGFPDAFRFDGNLDAILADAGISTCAGSVSDGAACTSGTDSACQSSAGGFCFCGGATWNCF